MTRSALVRQVIYVITAGYTSLIQALQVLVPLYAVHLGFTTAQIGVIVAFQAVLQIGLRIPVGLLCQAIGERRILAASFLSMAACWSMLWATPDYRWILAAQLLMGFSRAVFWVGVQSYVARFAVGGEASRLGAMQAVGGVGRILSPTIAGVLAASLGFGRTFLSGTGVSLAAALLVLLLQPLPLKAREGAPGAIWREVRHEAARPASVLAGVATGMAAVIEGVVGGFAPVHLKFLGAGDEMIGLLMSVRGGLAAAASFIGGRLLERGYGALVHGAVYLTMTASMVGVALTSAWPVAGILLALTGAAGSVLHVQGLVTATRGIPQEVRGLAVGLNGTYWSVGLTAGPFLFGLLAQGASLSMAMAATGGVYAIVGLVLRKVAAWSTVLGPPGAAQPGHPPPG
ncbi:MAG TPA: MFS transporter [Bacillota bacterium]